MSLTGGVTGSLPIVQKRMDAGTTFTRIGDWFRGRKEAGQPKVVEHKSADSLTVKAQQAKVSLNLTGLHRAATAPARLPGNAGPLPGAQAQGPQPVGVQANPVPPQVGQVAPDVVGLALLPTMAPPSPPVQLAAIRQEIQGLRADMERIAELHVASRTDGGFGVGVATKEGKLVERQATAQTAITGQLAKLDTLITGQPNADPAFKKEMADTRRALLSLAVEVEYPQTVAAARTPLGARMPPLGDSIRDLEKPFLSKLDTLIGHYLDQFPTNDMPDRNRAVPSKAGERVIRHIDDAIGRLERGPETTEKDDVIAFLKEAKTAIGLRVAMSSTVDSLAALRDRFKGDAELSKVSSGRLLKEFSHYGTVHRDGASAKPLDQLRALEVVDALAHSLANSAVPDVFKTEDPGVRKMLTALRIDQCQDLAASTFALSSTDKGFRDHAENLGDALGRPPTKSELQAILPQSLKVEFDKALKQGELAAKTREAYFETRNRLERILGTEDGVAYRPAIWLKVGTSNGKGDTDEVQRAATILKKLGKSNPEAAFMVAGLAVLEHQVAKLDKEALGLKYYDALTLSDFDSGRVLDYAGVSVKQMVKLGYDAGEAASFPESMRKLGNAGFTDVAHLDKHITTLYRAASETLTNQSIQNMVGDIAAGSSGAVGKRLLTNMLSDAVALQSGVPAKLGGDPSLKGTDPLVATGFAKVSTAAHTAISSDGDRMERLGALTDIFKETEKEIVSLVTQRADVETRTVAARGFLETAKTSGPTKGLDVAPDSPRGLRSAKTILTAVGKHEELVQLRLNGGSKDDIARTLSERDAALDQLRGFDTETMRRPWHAKLANFFVKAERPNVGELMKLKDVAKSIVFLREGAAGEREAIDTRIGQTASLREGLLAERRSEHPRAIDSVNQLVRAAVLSHWPADNVAHTAKGGKVVAAYEPAMKRAEIETTLRSWGLDVAAFEPEISAGLNATLERHDLANWAADFKPIDAATNLVPGPDTRTTGAKVKDSITTFFKETFSKEGAKNVLMSLVNKRAMDDTLRQELGAITNSLKEGDKFDFKSGYKLSLNTGKIPLEPSATVGIRGKVAASGISNLVLERSGDGYKVTARFGAQLQLGVDLIVDQKLTETAKMGGSVGGDITGTYLGGITETFPNTPEGRKACSDLILALSSGERPKASIFEAASDAATNREVAGKLGANAKGYIKAELTTQPFGNDGDMFSSAADDPGKKSGATNKVGIGASAGIEIAAALGGKYNAVRSFNKVAISTEKEITGAVTLNAKLYAKIPTATGLAMAKIMQESGAQDLADERFDKNPSASKTEGQLDVGSGTADEDLLSADAGFMLARSKKYKQEYTVSNRTEGGERLAKAEIVQRSNLRVGPELALLGIGSRDLAEKLETNKQFREDYEALKAFMGNEDTLQITYALTPDKVERIADLMAAADDFAKEGKTIAAMSLRSRATSILDNQESYEVSKVTVLTKSTVKDQVNRGNAILLRFDITAEAGSERSEVTLKWTPPK